MLSSLAFVIVAYLIGSISFAVVVSKAMRLPDPHDYGSGNPGATNVLRTGNKAAAALTLVGDGAKGWLAVFLAQHFAASFGVADIMLALSWPVGLVLATIWLVMAFGFKISSVAALTASFLAPIGAFYVFGNTLTAWIWVPIAALLFWRHRANIRQLLSGEERVIGR
jgi:glycerol-3-phosphate acyltransferase PlsY